MAAVQFWRTSSHLHMKLIVAMKISSRWRIVAFWLYSRQLAQSPKRTLLLWHEVKRDNSSPWRNLLRYNQLHLQVWIVPPKLHHRHPKASSKLQVMDQVQTMLELDPRDNLRQHISWVVWSANLAKRNLSFFNDLSHKVKTNINMFRSTMVDLVLC